MGMPKRYLFDVSFDQVGPDTAAAEPAETFGRDDIDAARQTAFAEGKESGAAEIRAAAENKAATALEAIASALPALIAAQDARSTEIERRAIEAVRTVVAKALPAYAAREPLAEIEALAGKYLIEALDEPRVVMRVSNEAYEPVREKIDSIAAASGYGGRIVLLADDELSGGDARIEWADGGAERRLADQLSEVDSALARVAESSATLAPHSS